MSNFSGRKINAQDSVKIPSPAPSYSMSTGRGRRKKRGVSSEVDDFEMEYTEETQGVEDAEGEDVDGEEGDDGEDKELYCFCQKLSYGEMIACDNAGCPYQWVSTELVLVYAHSQVCASSTFHV